MASFVWEGTHNRSQRRSRTYFQGERADTFVETALAFLRDEWNFLAVAMFACGHVGLGLCK